MTFAPDKPNLRTAVRPLIAPAMCVAIVAAALMSLGVWQIHRLAWKEAILARIDARIHQPPAEAPGFSQWAALQPEAYDYRHVFAHGKFVAGKEALIFRPSGPGQNEAAAAPGYLVLTPLQLDAGGVVLINRGFAPLGWKDQPGLRQPAPAGQIVVTGLMRPPEQRTFFTPADQPDQGVWYARDPQAMAAGLRLGQLGIGQLGIGELGIGEVAPFVIDADADPAALGPPYAGATVIALPNHHLSYALTWFGMAATLLVAFAILAVRRVRGTAR